MSPMMCGPMGLPSQKLDTTCAGAMPEQGLTVRHTGFHLATLAQSLSRMHINAEPATRGRESDCDACSPCHDEDSLVAIPVRTSGTVLHARMFSMALLGARAAEAACAAWNACLLCQQAQMALQHKPCTIEKQDKAALQAALSFTCRSMTTKSHVQAQSDDVIVVQLARARRCKSQLQGLVGQRPTCISAEAAAGLIAAPGTMQASAASHPALQLS